MKHKTTLLPIFVALALIISNRSMAGNIEKPSISGKTTYAIVVDSITLEKCRPEIDSYKQIVESEGLPTYIVSNNWSCPEQVRNELLKLYKNNNLEGAFFIGDIPIPMITKAQHLTSAFKMDEQDYPLGEVSVPSDRFYDDFDLEFEFVKDSTDGLKFFYHMSAQSKQYIECDIYSARLMAQASNGDKYKQISDYLKKAVEAHKEHNHFDTFVSYTGYGSYSECMAAWRAEQQILHEQFPGVFTRHNNAKFLRFSMEPYMKPTLIRELRRPDLDFMVLHAHGMPNRQYITDMPRQSDIDHLEYIKLGLRKYFRSPYEGSHNAATELIEKWGLDSSWYANYNTEEMLVKDSIEDAKTGILIEDVDAISPNARFVVMDACYNGDFRNDDFIAGKYIMTPGKCLVSYANSVNVLQDKSSFDLLGLLGIGARIGNWAKYSQILESHIFGDPTFKFTYHHHHAGHGHDAEEHHSHDINHLMSEESNDFWKGMIDNQNPEIQNVALIKLVRNNYNGIADILLDKVYNSQYAIVRFNAMMLLESLNVPQWHEALIAATNDSFEFTRRIAVNRMSFCGNPEFVPCLIDSYVKNYYALRVKFNILSTLTCFDKDLVLKEIDKYFSDKSFYHAQKYKEELIKVVSKDQAGEALKSLQDTSVSVRHKIARVRFLRNCPYHQITDGILKLLQDKNTDSQLKVCIVESLAWYRRSVERNKILPVLEKMLADKDFTSPEMEKELKRACTRLNSEK